jgi:cysteine desulfurase
MESRKAVAAALRDRLEQGILAAIPSASVNGSGSRLPNTTNIGFPGVDSDTLVSLLDQHGICVSSGSACLSDAVAPSHVLLAMTGSYQRASEAIRFSASHLNTIDEIDRTIDLVKKVVFAATAK